MSRGSTVVWVVPTLANVATYIESGLLTKANTADLYPGQTDRFTQAMQDTTTMVASNIQNRLGMVVSATDYSVPPELMKDVCWAIIGAMQSSYPGLGLSDDQKKQVGASQDKLEAIGTDDSSYRPSMPTDPAPSGVQGRPKAQVVRSTPRAITERSMSGLTLGVGSGDCDKVPSEI